MKHNLVILKTLIQKIYGNQIRRYCTYLLIKDYLDLKQVKCRVKQITKTIIFDPPSTKIKYLLDDGKEYIGEELEFDKELSRDNRLKDLLQ